MNTYARPRLALFPSLRVAELRERQSENGVGSAVNSMPVDKYTVLCKLFAARGTRRRRGGEEKRNTREVVRVYRVFAQVL